MSFVTFDSSSAMLQKVSGDDGANLQKISLCCASGKMQLKYVTHAFVKSAMSASGGNIDSQPGVASQSDLLPGVYEGGFKVWESTRDTAELILDDQDLVAGKRVFDIGCGSGLVGIACLVKGVQHVTFQDFNESVLKWYTQPNVVANHVQKNSEGACDLTKLACECDFISGDWSDVAVALASDSRKYDVIFTSETIYSEENYAKLANLIRTSLSPTGRAFVSGKTHYFGVGGGMRSFEEFLELDGHLTSNVYKVIDAPVQREILELRLKH